jgi:pSer/pThr/pTyr-binding forkhead associated (FHA) protein
MPKLIVTDEDHLRREFPISAGMTIGRQSGNHIQINEAKASRTHCRVRPDGDVIYLEDLNSSNGTKVNGQKIKSYALKNGDMVTIGGTTIVFEDENAPPPPPAPEPKAESESRSDDDDEVDLDEEPEGEDGGLTVALSAVEVARMDKKAVSKAKKAERAEKQAARGADSSAAHELFRPTSALSGPRRVASPHLVRTVTSYALLGIFILAAVWVLNNRHRLGGNNQVAVTPLPAAPVPAVPAVATPPENPVDLPPAVNATLPPVKPANPTETPPQKPADNEAAIAEELNKAIAERDRALASSNFLGARSILAQFVAAHPGGASGERARQELKDTEKLIDTALSSALEDAKKAARERKYRLVTQRCTRLLSSDPGGKYGAEAKTILTRMDEETEPRFKELDAAAKKELRAGQLDKAGEVLGRALDELGGTKWAAAFSAGQLQVIMSRSLLKMLDTERQKRASTGLSMPVRSSDGKVDGYLSKINGLALEVRRGGMTQQVVVGALGPNDFGKLLETAGLGNRHVELAYLWLLMDNKIAAQKEIEKALQDPEQTAAALHLAGDVKSLKNLKSYDFSKWQHQTDWEALSGSWSTQDDKYVLESAEGGDTSLLRDAIGGAFSADKARISFDFELTNPNAGYYFAFEFGENEQNNVSALFTSEGVALTGNINGAASEKAAWSNAPTHVDIAITGDELALNLNGKPAAKLKVNGLSGLRGTITFRVRETACAVDNVILRNAQ